MAVPWPNPRNGHTVSTERPHPRKVDLFVKKSVSFNFERVSQVAKKPVRSKAELLLPEKQRKSRTTWKIWKIEKAKAPVSKTKLP